MEQTLVNNSVSRNHWINDNDNFSFFLEKDKEAIDNVLYGVKEKLNTNKYETDLVSIDACAENTVVFKEKKISLKFPIYNKRYDVLRKNLYSKKTKNWTGVVLDISNEVVFVKLFDSDDNTTYETIEFSLKYDISDDDKELLSVGSVLYWYVGYVYENGTIRKQSEVRLRRVVDGFEIEGKDFNEFVDKINDDFEQINWID